MRVFSSRHARLILLCVLLFVISSVLASAGAAESRDALWNIVSTCTDLHAPHYCDNCSAPRVDSPCGQGRACKETTEVWEETTDYVAIRDRKMCGCEAGFVHGLAIPRTRVIGIEDPNRPDNIWSFAWAAAKKRISNEAEIALAVNPASTRGQDQLHVHIVRLQPDARGRFDDSRSARVSSFGDIWSAAAKKAALLGLKDYGVLVTKQAEGDFIVLVGEKSPEKAFTQGECR
ncbi:MAG TPA: CDP-diacylglycerol diphosphatase [Nitrospirota bacterium]|nr:CDP-diacylglycerol diphosphatase [Nitrospirota bacterium]